MAAPFTIDNLPYGVVSKRTVTFPYDSQPRLAVAYGTDALDIAYLAARGFFDGIAAEAGDPESPVVRYLSRRDWNAFAALPAAVRGAFRAALRRGIEAEAAVIDQARIALDDDVVYHLPMASANYSDFYCSREHAQNCSTVMGAGGALPANWTVVPSVYSGRTSSLAPSGTPVTRPCGVFVDDATGTPAFQPEDRLDFELEIGVWLATPVPRGQRLSMHAPNDTLSQHIFGLSLLNDWSARRLQMFEMAPLGPFHGKGACTTVGPWIVPLEALEPFRGPRHAPQVPPPLPHLAPVPGSDADLTFDVHVAATLVRGAQSFRLGTSNVNELHWTPLQMLVHLASAGAGLATGDVFGTGTLSSARTDDAGAKTGLGCLVERQLARHGVKVSAMPDGLLDTFLQDGDEVVLEAWCEDKDGNVVLGFGECRGQVRPAV